jgi:hypothetical protein
MLAFELSVPAHKAPYFFSLSPRLENLTARCEELRRIQRMVDALLPRDGSLACAVAPLEDGALALLAANGAVAAKLRHMAPTLLSGLKKRGLEVTAIRVRAQAAHAERRRKPEALPPPSSEVLDSFASLAGGLQDGPLKTALEHFLAHQRRED